MFRYDIGGSVASEQAFYLAKTRKTFRNYVYDLSLLAFIGLQEKLLGFHFGQVSNICSFYRITKAWIQGSCGT